MESNIAALRLDLFRKSKRGLHHESVPEALDALCDAVNAPGAFLRQGVELLCVISEKFGSGLPGSRWRKSFSRFAVHTLGNSATEERKSKRCEKALEYLEQARAWIDDVPYTEGANIFLTLSAVLSDLKRHDEAEDAAKRAVRLHETDLLRIRGDAFPTEKVAALAIAYNNWAVQVEFIRGAAVALPLYAKAVALADTYLDESDALRPCFNQSYNAVLLRSKQQTSERIASPQRKMEDPVSISHVPTDATSFAIPGQDRPLSEDQLSWSSESGTPRSLALNEAPVNSTGFTLYPIRQTEKTHIFPPTTPAFSSRTSTSRSLSRATPCSSSRSAASEAVKHNLPPLRRKEIRSPLLHREKTLFSARRTRIVNAQNSAAVLKIQSVWRRIRPSTALAVPKLRMPDLAAMEPHDCAPHETTPRISAASRVSALSSACAMLLDVKLQSETAARRIQRGWRQAQVQRLSRWVYHRRRAAAAVIQKWFRILRHRKRRHAVVSIGAAWRSYQVRRAKAFCLRGIVAAQRKWRVCKIRDRALRCSERRRRCRNRAIAIRSLLRLARRYQAASQLQRMYRLHAQRGAVARSQAAALRLQAAWGRHRIRLARRKVVGAACRIQNLARAFLARKRIARRCARGKSATRLQSWVRMRYARRNFLRARCSQQRIVVWWKRCMAERQRTSAAQTIQMFWWQRVLAPRRDIERRRVRAAVRIQSLCRRVIVRTRLDTIGVHVLTGYRRGLLGGRIIVHIFRRLTRKEWRVVEITQNAGAIESEEVIIAEDMIAGQTCREVAQRVLSLRAPRAFPPDEPAHQSSGEQSDIERAPATIEVDSFLEDSTLRGSEVVVRQEAEAATQRDDEKEAQDEDDKIETTHTVQLPQQNGLRRRRQCQTKQEQPKKFARSQNSTPALRSKSSVKMFASQSNSHVASSSSSSPPLLSGSQNTSEDSNPSKHSLSRRNETPSVPTRPPEVPSLVNRMKYAKPDQRFETIPCAELSVPISPRADSVSSHAIDEAVLALEQLTRYSDSEPEPMAEPGDESLDAFMLCYLEKEGCDAPGGPWKCAHCDFVNEISPSHCVMCDAIRFSANETASVDRKLHRPRSSCEIRVASCETQVPPCRRPRSALLRKPPVPRVSSIRI